MTEARSRAAPPKAITGLAVAVLVAHIAALQHAPAAAPPIPPITLPFSTRVIALTPVAQKSHPVPTQPRVKRPRSTALAKPVASRMPSVPDGANPPSAPPSESASAPEPAQSPADVAATPADSSAAQTEPAETARPVRDPELALARYTVPVAMLLNYEVSSNKFPFGLNAQLRWQHDAENYEARLAYGAFGQSRVQTSRGQITVRGLEPVRFSDKYRSEVAAHFVRDKGKVTFSANTPDVALLAGAQDRLSILIQLAAMIGGEPERFPGSTTITIQTIGPRDADSWLFTMGNAETLTLPGGELGTLKLIRNPREPFDQKVEVWLAPTLGYLPARIRITEPNGDYVDQKWASTEPPG